MTNPDITSRMRRRSLRTGALLVVMLVGTATNSPLHAQSRRPLSLQGSLLSTLVTADGTSAPGLGGEAQLRVNALGMQQGPGVLSMGGGGQYTAHVFTDGLLTVSGAFIEPRVAWGGAEREDWFRYAAVRAALLRQSSPAATSTTGFALGAGGGLVHTLGPRHNLDLGATVLYQQFADALTPSGRTFRFSGAMSFALKVGITIGLGG